MATIGQHFTFASSSPRVVFGTESILTLPAELNRLGVRSPVIVSSPTRISLAAKISAVLHGASMTPAGILAKAVVHVPVDVTEDAMAYMRSANADSIISAGGGSAIGLGKALSLRTELPHLCVPTTYSGSEMTAILGELRDGKKVATTDPKIMPTTVVYDVDLTMGLPKTLTAASGLNALAHAIEALYAENANPVMSLLAADAVRSLSTWLPKLVTDLSSCDARSAVLYGAFLAGLTVASTGIALQHKLAHVVAGSCDLPHAITHSILLPHTIAYNSSVLSRDTLKRLGQALGNASEATPQDIVTALNKLLRNLGISPALKDLGMKGTDVNRTADIVLETPYWNPRPLDREKIHEIIRRAWAGEPARADL